MFRTGICLAIMASTLLLATSSLSAETPGPRFNYPQNGQELDLEGDYLFQVGQVPETSGYLWGFFQDGKLVWENQRDEGMLSDVNYGLSQGSPGWRSLHAGHVEVWCRAYVNNEWTAATKITIKLRPRK